MEKFNLKKSLKALLIIGTTILVAYSFKQLAVSAHGSTQQTKFAVTPILNDLPVNKRSNFFDLKLLTDKTYKLPVAITNQGHKKIKIVERVANAYTSDNGIISYDDNIRLGNHHKKSQLTKYVKGNFPKTITVNPGDTKLEFIVLRTGKTVPRGQILGGLVFSDAEVPKTSFGIRNRVNYVISVSLDGKEKVEVRKPTIKKIAYGVFNGESGYQITLENDLPIILHDGKIKLDIKMKRKMIAGTQWHSFSMAPSSTTKMFIPEYIKPDGSKLKLYIQFKGGNLVYGSIGRLFSIQEGHGNVRKVNSVKTFSTRNGILIGIIFVTTVTALWAYRRNSK